MKNSMGGILYGGCFVLLILSVAGLAWKVRELRAEENSHAPGISVRGLTALFDQELISTTGQGVKLSTVGVNYVTLFFFTQMDCAPCLEQLPDLNQLAQRRSDMRVYGILSGSRMEEAEQIGKNFGLQYPLLVDTSGAILEKIHPPRRPWVIIVRVSDRRLVYEDPPSSTKEQRESFISRALLAQGPR